jgi:uncharacterized Zn ribbon protein
LVARYWSPGIGGPVLVALNGPSLVVKREIKVKGSRFVGGLGGHNIACRLDGIDAKNLKSECAKKS